MTQDEIIRMAREVGLIPHEANIAYMQGNYPSKLERFAALVAAHEREKLKNVAIFSRWYQESDAAVLAEREACAKVCEEMYDLHEEDWDYCVGLVDCAAAIRARGEK